MHAPFPPRRKDVAHLQAGQVTSPKLAVDGRVEQRQVASVVCHLQADADRPDVFRQQGALLAEDASFVPGRTFGADRRKIVGGHGVTSRPPAPP